MANPQGGNPNTRIFSSTGCLKLGFFASTPTAKQFRTWAATELAARPAPVELKPPVSPAAVYVPPPRPDAKPRITRQVERVIFEMFVAGQSISDLAKHLRLSRTAASLVLHGKYPFGPTTGAPDCAPALIEAVAARHLAVEQGRLAAMQDRIANRYLCSAHNLALAAALDQVGHQLQRAPARALAAPMAKTVGCAERSDAHRSSAHPTKIGGAA